MRRVLILMALAGLAGMPRQAAALVPMQWVCLFDADSAELLPACQQRLRELVAARPARFMDSIQLTVRGTTDTREGRNAAGRQRLSEQRARAVAGYLAFLGVPARLIRAEGRGAGRAEPEARRVEITEGWDSP